MKNKPKRLIVDRDNALFEIKKGAGNSLDLIFSELDKEWTDPGKLAASLRDTGDGFAIHFSGRISEIDLDYSEAYSLYILLRKKYKKEGNYKPVEYELKKV